MVDVKNSASSFRLLALFPPYIRTAAGGLSDSAVSIRRKEITHRGMQAVFANMETVLNHPLDFYVLMESTDDWFLCCTF